MSQLNHNLTLIAAWLSLNKSHLNLFFRVNLTTYCLVKLMLNPSQYKALQLYRGVKLLGLINRVGKLSDIYQLNTNVTS